MEKVKFSKIKEEAKIPKKRLEDAGYDIYACFDEDNMIIRAHQTKLIPTGIASQCSEDYCFILRERGSTGSKGLGLRSGVIDSGYRGEWFVAITNHNDFDYIICKEGVAVPSDYKVYPYEKAIAQCLILPVPRVKIEETPYEELIKISSERGTGALGSSNK